MLKPLFRHHHTLAVPAWVKDLWRRPLLQITVSKSVVSMRFEGNGDCFTHPVMHEKTADRYGLRMDCGRFGFAVYTDRMTGTKVFEGDSGFALAE